MHALGREPDARFASAEDLGVALGEAAAAGWGNDWLDHAGLAILGSQRLSAAARSGPPPGEGADAEHGTASGEAGPAAPSLRVVRAGGALRLEGLDLNRINRGDLVDVEDLIHPPPPPTRAIVATSVLAFLALLIAVIGLGQPGRSGSLHRGEVLLAGSDIATGSRVDANLGHDVGITVRDPELAARADEAVLKLSTLGIPLGDASAPLIQGRADIDPRTMRLLAAGKVTGEVELRNHGRTVARQEFPFRATNPWYLTALGIGALLVLLIAFANLESSLKPLLRGRSRRLSLVGAAVWGAVAGVGVAVLSAAFSLAELTIVTLIVVGALGAAAGVASCYAALGIGRRRRLRRAMKRAERTIRQRATA
jgi:hypothetical protein